MMKNALAAIALVFAVSVPALAKDVMDVADLVEKEGPAVVNISTTKMVKRGQEFGDEGMQEFFRRFFPGMPGMPGMPGGQEGGQGPGPMQEIPARGEPLAIGKGRVLREGDRVALLSLGTRLAEALKAAEDLAAMGIRATVADARFAKPIDRDLVLRLARDHEALITIEEGSGGGFGAAVLTMLAEAGCLDGGLKARTMTLPDSFIDHDTQSRMYAAAGLDARGIVARVVDTLGRPSAGTLGKIA